MRLIRSIALLPYAVALLAACGVVDVVVSIAARRA